MLTLEPMYQRVDRGHGRAIAAKWDRRKAGVLLVSYRNGGFYVIDGQHRWIAAQMFGETSLTCQVYENLTIAQEAFIFGSQMEDTRKLTAQERFGARPDYFLYENNKSMAPSIREQITRELGVEPIPINSALVSGQSRHRLYWTNIPNVQQPEDRGVLLRDVLESGVCWREKAYTIDSNYYKTQGQQGFEKQFGRRKMVAEKVTIKALTENEMDYMVRETKGGRNHFDFDYFHDANKDKSSCVTANT